MKYVDLFSGCGGLSLGLERAGAELVLAVEKSDMAARTFYHNLVADAADPGVWQRHLAKALREQVAAKVLVKELAELLEDDVIMGQLAAQNLDMVVGGPPCQGFSLAGRRNRDDVRNKLPWQFLEFVHRTHPRAVVIENVVGMGRTFNKDEESSFTQLRTALAETGPGYVVQGMQVNAVHFGAPQHRPRLLLVGLRRDEAARLGICEVDPVWHSDFQDKLEGPVPALVPVPTVALDEVRTVGDAISDLLFTGSALRANNHLVYRKEMQGRYWGLASRARGTKLNHVARRHGDKTVDRFRMYQFFASRGIDPRVLNRIASMTVEDAQQHLFAQFRDIKFPANAPDGTRIANNLPEFVSLALGLATRKHSQRVLSWDQPARTVVTLPDDYVHPIEPRVFSVREMARFQGFPDDFEFLGKETTGAARRRIEVPQYSQVGNAVSPHLSWAIGKMLNALLNGPLSSEVLSYEVELSDASVPMDALAV